jgi:hypothetical protein
MTDRRGVAVPRPVAVLAVAFLIVLAVATGVLYSQLPTAAVPSPSPPAPAVPALAPAEPVTGRFAKLPYACALLTRSQFAALVPDPFNRRNGHGGCEWDSITGNPRHGLAITLRVLPNDARAREFFAALRADAKSPPVVSGVGDEAYQTGGPVTSGVAGFARNMVVRLGNVIAEVQYTAEHAPADRDGHLERGSRRAAVWAVGALERLG